MITFLPYTDFVASAQCLDRQRLGKQRVEAKQILWTLLGYSEAWKNHPATRMWQGYEEALAEYTLDMCKEWTNRGYTDNIAKMIHQEFPGYSIYKEPAWLGDNRLHSSHRANLLRKDLIHYSQFSWTEQPEKGYYWPC